MVRRTGQVCCLVIRLSMHHFDEESAGLGRTTILAL